ncbi:MAG: TrkA family potassium uptake protein [Arcanobacterium sp.]|nr:TrkA family potassium uptake protein [Arcanobacterium sp.]
MIAGAGSVGRSIARELTNRKHKVTIIDADPKAMRVAKVPLADWILADACELSVLHDIELTTFDVVVAATGDDKANLVLSLLSKTEFGVPRVVARVNNPANEWLFTQSWGVDFPVSTPRIMTMLIEDAVASGELVRRVDFRRSAAGLYQVTLPSDAPIVGSTVQELWLPADVILSAVLRDGVPMAATLDLVIRGGDQLLFLVSDDRPDGLASLSELVSSPEDEAAPLDRGRPTLNPADAHEVIDVADDLGTDTPS